MSRFFDPRLLGHARSERPRLILTIALGAATAAFTVLQAFALSRAVDAVFLRGAGLPDIAPWLIGLCLLGAARGAAGWGSEVTAGRAAQRIKSSLRQKLTAHILALGPAYTRGERTGELVNTAVEGIDALDAYFSQYLPQLALAALAPILFLAIIIPIDPLSGLVLLLTAPLIPIFMVLIGNLADGLARRQWTALGRMSSHFLDVLQGLTTLKLFDRSREQVEVIRAISNRHRDATLEVLRVAFLSALVLEMVGTLGTAIVAVETGLRLLAGQLAFEQAFFVLILAPEFYLPLRLLGTRFHAATAGVTAARRIFEVLDTPSPLDSLTAAPPAPALKQKRGNEIRNSFSSPHVSFARTPSPTQKWERGQGVRDSGVRVSFRDVSYTYPGRDRPALDHVSFDIAPGEKVALVGATGAGKSTVAALLLRFIRPVAGEVIAEGPTAWVPQLPYLFDGSVIDNIRLGRPDAPVEDVEQAARDAHAAEFVAALPDGYRTRIGERGARLSGGQAQRIALARAFLLDAPLVVLDEATANLDAETEAAIEESLDRLLEGRAALIIAHRLQTVRSADRIIVLSGGRVVEMGTHDELVAARGEYWRLVSAAEAIPNPMEHPERRRRSIASEEQEHPFAALRASSERRQHSIIPEKQEHPERRRRTLPPESKDAEPELTEAHPSTPHREPMRCSAQDAGNRPNLPARRVLSTLLAFVAPFWRYVALSVVLGFLTIASSVGLLATSAWLIASATLQPSIATLQVAIVGVRFFGISRGITRYFERLASHQVTFRVLAEVRAWFYAAIEPLSPVRLAAYTSGDLLSRILGDISTLENFYVRGVAPPLVALLTLVAMGLFFAAYSPGLAFTLLVFLLIAGAAVPLFSQGMSRAPGRRLAETRAALTAALVDSVQGAADLLAFNAAGAQIRRVTAADETLSAAQGKMLSIASLTGAFGTVLIWSAVAATLAVATPLIADGRLPGVDFAVIALAALASFEAVLPLPQAAQYLETSIAAGRRLLAIAEGEARQPDALWRDRAAVTRHGDSCLGRLWLGRPWLGRRPATARPATARPATARPATARPATVSKQATADEAGLPPAIEFQNLTVRYEPGALPALENVTFSIPSSSRVAIVGPSGAGKSSIVNALLRFVEPEAGVIRVGGIDLAALAPEDARRQAGVVAQHTHLFNTTVRENLRLARPGATQAEIELAARAAQVHDFIGALPQGYDTWVGEQGLRLSGGERQRLAIARAVLRDAPILLLDEPTANLDAATEVAVMAALEPLMASPSAPKTTILITHRLNGLARMDQIFVLDRGRVVAQGTHAALLGRDGLYRRLWERQRHILSTPDLML